MESKIEYLKAEIKQLEEDIEMLLKREKEVREKVWISIIAGIGSILLIVVILS